MLLLITKYNLSPKWVQLLIYFLLYVMYFKLHLGEVSISECMQPTHRTPGNIYLEDPSLRIEGPPPGFVHGVDPPMENWLRLLPDNDPIRRAITIENKFNNQQLHAHILDREDVVRNGLRGAGYYPSENAGITGLVQSVKILDRITINHDNQLREMEEGLNQRIIALENRTGHRSLAQNIEDLGTSAHNNPGDFTIKAVLGSIVGVGVGAFGAWLIGLT